MIDQLKPYLASLTQYMVNSGMELAPLPKVIFKQDEENAKDVLARTAHYNPNDNSITLFTSARHPKDVLRSYAHEMIHHCQNLENRLNNINTTNINEDDYLKEIEREAYEKGNMMFRGWENNYKQNMKENKMNYRESLRKMIKEELQNMSLINEDLDTDIANVNKQIEALITQMVPLKKKKAELDKKKADLEKKKADQDLAASKVTTESTANVTGTGATMSAGTGEQYATPKAFKKKKK